MIVIDVGCARYGADYSIERLIEEFCPQVLYGFDPNLSGLRAALAQGRDVQERCGTDIRAEAWAAWTYDGEIGFRSDGLTSWISEDPGAPKVHCFDLAELIVNCDVKHLQGHEDHRLILKIDAEGSEYDLLSHLMILGADELLDLAIVEWHPQTVPNAEELRHVIEREIACDIQEWPW